jgi:hypothetical protein
MKQGEKIILQTLLFVSMWLFNRVRNLGRELRIADQLFIPPHLVSFPR